MTAGYSAREIQQLLASKEWKRLRSGVYATGATADRAQNLRGDVEHLLNVEALVLSKKQAAISHGSAVRWHGLTHLRGLSEIPTATRPGHTEYVTSKAALRRAWLPREHVQCTGEVWVTTVARTVADVARELPILDTLVIGDNALSREMTTRAEIATVLETQGGWPGITRARHAVAGLDARTQTPLETLCRWTFASRELPHPELQVWVFDKAGFVGIVDGMWVDRFVAYEADGDSKYALYGNDLTVLDEKRRHVRLEQCGIEVCRFCWRELWYEPAECVARVRESFARAAASRPPRARLYLVDSDTLAPHPHGEVGRLFPRALGLRCVYDGLGST